jgi:hypothetical protein
MWTCVSRRRLRAEAAVGIGLLAVAGAAFRLAQAEGWIVGGAIALPKLMWLAYALLAWFVLPPLVARDGRAQPALRRLYAIFFWNMTARGVVELAMMYGWRSWHPYYGAAQDVFSIGLIAWLSRAVAASGPLDRLLLRHAFVLCLMLAVETSFALYFAANFVTMGGQALYFVPEERRYSTILMSTGAAVLCLTLYFPWFLRGWLYGSNESGG